MIEPQRQPFAASAASSSRTAVVSIEKPPPRVQPGELRLEVEVAVLHLGDAAPGARHGPEHLPERPLRGQVPLARDAAGVGVEHLRPPLAHELGELRDRREDVERLEPGDDDRAAGARGERLEDPVPGDDCGVAGGDVALDVRALALRHDLHRGRDVLVHREDREVVRDGGERDGGRRDGGRLEAAPEEHDLVGRVRAGELDRLRDRVDDLDLPALRLRVGERAGGAGQPEHVAVGADARALGGERDRLVHLRAVGHAHRAAGAHDELQLRRQHRAQAEARDRLLVAAAHVHHRDGPADAPRRSAAIASARARARAGSRNFSSAKRSCAASLGRPSPPRSRRGRRPP